MTFWVMPFFIFVENRKKSLSRCTTAILLKHIQRRNSHFYPVTVAKLSPNVLQTESQNGLTASSVRVQDLRNGLE